CHMISSKPSKASSILTRSQPPRGNLWLNHQSVCFYSNPYRRPYGLLRAISSARRLRVSSRVRVGPSMNTRTLWAARPPPSDPARALAAGERIPPFARLEVVADRNAGGLVALVQQYQRSLVRAAFLVDTVEHRQAT